MQENFVPILGSPSCDRIQSNELQISRTWTPIDTSTLEMIISTYSIWAGLLIVKVKPKENFVLSQLEYFPRSRSR